MREQIMRCGSFVEIYLFTPLEVCERRDPKGLYARARAGQLQHMTGIDDPYEPPPRPELELNGAELPVAEMVGAVAAFLMRKGLLQDKGRS